MCLWCICSMMHSIVLLISNIHQSIIGSVNFRFFHTQFSSNNWNKSLCFYIRNYFCMDLSISLEQTKHNGFHSSSSSSLSSDTSWSKVRLISFNISCPDFILFSLTEEGYRLPNIPIPILCCFWIKSCEYYCFI